MILEEKIKRGGKQKVAQYFNRRVRERNFKLRDQVLQMVALATWDPVELQHGKDLSELLNVIDKDLLIRQQ
jgi:hypothetical protein